MRTTGFWQPMAHSKLDGWMLTSFVISRSRKGGAWKAAPERRPGKRNPVTQRQVAGDGLPWPGGSSPQPPWPSHPPPASSPTRLPSSSLATCGVGQIWAFVPRPSPAALRGAPRANTAECRGSRAAPAPQIFGSRGGGLARQLWD